MNKYLLAFIFAITLSLAQVSHAEPKFYGELGVRGVDQEDQDFSNGVYRANVGLKGLYDVGSIKTIYQIEVDLADAADENDGSDDLRVRQAKVVMPTPVGIFVLGRTQSAQYLDIYGGIDIFESNSFEESPNNFFRQATHGSKVAAYVTPTFHGFKLVGAALTLENDNDVNADVIAGRVVYTNGGLRVAAGQVTVTDAMLPTTEDYIRRAAGLSYDGEQFHIGFTAEDNKDDPAGDSTVLGGAFTYNIMDNLKVGLGYQSLDKDGSDADDSLMIYQVKYNLNEQVALWGEVGDFDLAGNDNASVGVTVSF